MSRKNKNNQESNFEGVIETLEESILEVEEEESKEPEKVEEIKNVKITSNEVQVVSSIRLNFQGLLLEAGEKYNFTREAFEEIKKKYSNLEVFIERGVVEVE